MHPTGKSAPKRWSKDWCLGVECSYRRLCRGYIPVRSMGDETMKRAAESVLAKIGATLPEGRAQQLFHAISQVYRPDARIRSSVDMDAIRAACFDERALRIEYADKEGARTHKRFCRWL